MQLAGKYGAGVLSVSVIRDRGTAPDLKKFWQIAEETAAEYGHTIQRADWRMALHVYLADSRKEAMAQARVKAGRYQREYFEQTIGLPAVFDGPADEIIDEMVDRGAWCVGTPDDLIAHIKRLDEESGGFGGLLIQATEWGTREQVLHSYELIARYVKPHFQGSLANLQASRAWSSAKREEIMDLRAQAIEKAKREYFTRSGS
jgi:limonene 1,2-monooxygenase